METPLLVEMMGDVLLPTAEMVALMHAAQLRRFGGGAGLRDRALLEGAVSRAATAILYGNADLGQDGCDRDAVTAACAMGEGIVRNHPFVDGNKRTAFSAIIATMTVNGCRLLMEPIKVARLMVDLSGRRIASSEFRDAVRTHVALDPALKRSLKGVPA